MKPLLISLSTAVCALAGWNFGASHHAARGRAAPPGELGRAPLASTPDTTASATLSPAEVHAVFQRLRIEFPDERQSEEFAARLYAELQDLPGDQFGEAIANLFADADVHGRMTAPLLVGLWAERDLPAAREWWLGLTGIGNEFSRPIFDTWRRADPAGMIEWIKANAAVLESKSMLDEARSSVVKVAARTDPEAGFRTLAMLSKGKPSTFSGALYLFWAEHDPEAAAARALTEQDEKTRADATVDVARQWAGRDPAAARAWVEKLSDPILSERALLMIGSRLGWEDPGKGLDYLAALPQTNATRDALAQNVSMWAELDLSAAIAWTVNQPDESPGSPAFAKAIGGQSAGKIERAIAALPPEQRAPATQRWQAALRTKLNSK